MMEYRSGGMMGDENQDSSTPILHYTVLLYCLNFVNTSAALV
jgi:hypothetical protein